MKLTTSQSAFVVANLPLARMLASRLSRGMQAADRDDAASNAAIGLIDAVLHYDQQQGPFGRFARKHILGRVLRYRQRQERHCTLFGFTLLEEDESLQVFDPSQHEQELLEVFGACLPVSWRRIIRWRWVEEWSLAEIADKIGVTVQRVSQIIAESRRRILAMRQEGEL